jgi:flavin-dependent dehydrogenase
MANEINIADPVTAGIVSTMPANKAELSSVKLYDAAIIGGGLAGLALSIQLSRKGYSVILFEKEKYPFHKVCGEYISLESWDFLKRMGLPLDKWQLPVIKKLLVSSPKGKLIKHSLPMGGFGISRYKIDTTMAEIAKSSGVEVHEETKVTDIISINENFVIQSSAGNFYSKIAVGSYGKRSNLDVKWKRNFINAGKNKLNNYIGVKYHIQTSFPGDTIALHNFNDGYCGISRIENDKFCLCYLTTADLLQKNNNSIKEMEQNVLCKNPFLKEIFCDSSWLYDAPLTISQISFDKKTQVEDHVLMIGDAAGMITPLCGNGMSMALHASKIAFNAIDQFLQGRLSQVEMEKIYGRQWRKQFAGRLRTGRMIQKLFGKNRLTNLFISTVKPFPGLITYLVRQTHGKPF